MNELRRTKSVEKVTCPKNKKKMLIACGVVLGIAGVTVMGAICYHYIVKHPSFNRWLSTAPLQEIEKVRGKIQAEYMNPKVSLERKTQICDLFSVFDNAIEKRKWAGQPYVGPSYHREHGFGLYKQD